MKRTLLMPCMIAVGLVVVALWLAGVEAGTLWAVAALACPLMMLFMMGGMFRAAQRHVGHRASDPARREDTAVRQ
jgi:hypothetical protein